MVRAGLTLAVVALHSVALDIWLKAGATTPAHTRPDAFVSVRAVPAAVAHAVRSPAATPTIEPSPSSRATPIPTRPTPRADTPAAPPSPFLTADQLDRRPTPVSAPDTRWLDALANQPISGLPLRLRLFITAVGEVVAVEPVEVNELDVFALPALEAMFRDTAFLPGRHEGRDVASQIDLDVQLDGGLQ